MIMLALIIPNLFLVMIGLAHIIPGGPVLIRLALISPDLFQVLIGLAPLFLTVWSC